jgi:hypothetical protein
MIRTFLIIAFLLSSILSCDDLKKNADPLPNIIASYTESEIIIDGLLIESIWQKTQSILLRENRTGQIPADSTYFTSVFTVYDRDNLYIAFICNDSDIWGNFTDRDQHLWTEEAVEVFIDTDTISHTYVEIEVSPKNILFDSYIVDPVDIDIEATKEYDLPGIKTAVSVDGSVNAEDDPDRQWTVEIAIPIDDLVDENYMILPGKTEWRINFYRIERKRTGESMGYAWSPTGARFHKPAVFGVLGFGSQN